MADRPSDLAERMSDREATFKLPVETARAEVREFLNQPAQAATRPSSINGDSFQTARSSSQRGAFGPPTK
jgi:hypothetical protein